jgi:hypothetical protein
MTRCGAGINAAQVGHFRVQDNKFGRCLFEALERFRPVFGFQDFEACLRKGFPSKSAWYHVVISHEDDGPPLKCFGIGHLRLLSALLL